jgi:hypothetical protein
MDRFRSSKLSNHLPTDPKERKKIPLWSGLMQYFPDALVAVAKLSYVGNLQHNPGQPLHWAREKSTDQEDTILRHLLESGTTDTDGVLHSTKVAWRALAKLQLELEDNAKSTCDPKEPSRDSTLYFSPKFLETLRRNCFVVSKGINTPSETNSGASNPAFWYEGPNDPQGLHSSGSD